MNSCDGNYVHDLTFEDIRIERVTKGAPIRLPGGALDIRWAEDGHLYMTGPAETVFTGEFEP